MSMDVQKVHAPCYITTMNNKQNTQKGVLMTANQIFRKIAAEIIAEVKLKRSYELMGVYLMGDAITRQACQQKANKLVDTIVRTLGA